MSCHHLCNSNMLYCNRMNAEWLVGILSLFSGILRQQKEENEQSFDSIVNIINIEIQLESKEEENRRCVGLNVNKMGIPITFKGKKELKMPNQLHAFQKNGKLSIKYCCCLCHRNNGCGQFSSQMRRKKKIAKLFANCVRDIKQRRQKEDTFLSFFCGLK